MKKMAKALAPAGVCAVAATGITGGFSPGFVLLPVLGTSAGTDGAAGDGRTDVLVIEGRGDGVVGRTVRGALIDGVGPGDVERAPRDESVHPQLSAATSASTTNAAFRPMPE